ncbi:hypothetical protein GGF46_005198, partial [Coemansia sp. RSA 552]
MAQPPPPAGAPYTANYSFHGMHNIASTNEPVPNDFADTSSIASGAQTPRQPQPDYGHYQVPPQQYPHPGAAVSFADPQYPPPPEHQPYGPPEHQPYGPPPQHGGPVPPAYTSEGYDSGTATPDGHRPRRAPTEYNRSSTGPSEDGSESEGGENPNTFLSALKSGLKHIELMELVPIAGVIGASAYHYFKHRGAKHAVPFEEPQWMRYLNNVAFAHNAYGMMKQQPGGRPHGQQPHSRYKQGSG